MSKNDMKPELKNAVKEAIEWTTGIYPMGGVDKDTINKGSNDYKAGWNDANRDRTQRFIRVRKWLLDLPEPKQTQVSELLIEDKISLHIEDSKIELYVNCNDVFAWGCADDELLPDSEISKYVEMSKTSWGSIKWVCQHREEKPQYPMIWDMSEAGEWDEKMESLPDNHYNKHVGWDQTPTKPWRNDET